MAFFVIKFSNMAHYNFGKIEKKWQKVWAKNKHKIWHTAMPGQHLISNPKHYILDMFPYPSGEGLHVGHAEVYTASDIVSRYYRMKGFNVLHPMGWDAFGLPAENYAIKTKTHPREVVKKNVQRFKEQLQSLGLSYDWQREINTTDPEYYKWTQWIFLQLFKKGLAYEAETPVNWCTQDKTVIANEEVADGYCERCGGAVERKNLKQWILKITAYADRLLEDLNGLDWPERVKEMQRNWIGRSEGAIIKFKVPMPTGRQESSKFEVSVFTTRPDTLDGATYVVLAPEHPLVASLLNVKNQSISRRTKIKNIEEVLNYIERSKHRSERERQENKEKTGVELKGVKAINPLNNEELPVWIADYVLLNYGTGAIMAVPQHDERDREFAEKFKLPIINRPLININEVIKKVSGKKIVNYKLRDWVFSRQRYWGEPIPIIKCEKCGNQPVLEEDLPVKLPEVKNYEPTGKAESPLAGIEKWVNVKCPKCGGQAKRETNTMPQWAGSCWYYLAYLRGSQKSKVKSQKLVDPESEKYWLPVDFYIGGVEFAATHLLYARFWHKFLYDIGIVVTKEPFKKLINQGLILGPDGQKMSKSRGNVVNPDDVVKNFGADSLRLYEMFMGPLGDAKSWDPRGIVGSQRFLSRVHGLIGSHAKMKSQISNFKPQINPNDQNSKIEKLLHQTIRKVSEDIENFRFNTAISALMILMNGIEKQPLLEIRNSKLLIKLLFPFAPHLAQELWEKIGSKTLLDYEEWPKWDPNLIKEKTFQLVIQINGRMRDIIVVDIGISQEEAEKISLNREQVKKWLGNQKVKKTIFVKDRLINFIV